MSLESVREVTRVEATHIRCCPSWEVNTVCYIADVQLLLEVSRPHITEDILRYLSVQPRHTINLLREVASEYRHRETLVRIVRINLTEVDILIPSDAECIRIVRHILTNHRLRECIVSRRYRGVSCKERRRAYNLQRLRERELLARHEVTNTLYTDKCSVALVAVVNLLLDTHLCEGADTTDAEQDLLLQTVLPIATIEVVSYLTILLQVSLVVGIEQVQRSTTNLATPYAGAQSTAWKCHLGSYPRAILLTNREDRQLKEVLCLVSSLLRTLCRKTLGKVSVAIQKTYGHHWGISIRSLLQVVAGQDSKTSRVDLQRVVQTILHREVSNLRSLWIWLLVHILLELRIHSIHLCKERLVLLNLRKAIHRQLIEQCDRVAINLHPQLLVDSLEQITGTESPAPPQVARQLLEWAQACRQRLLNHYALPIRTLHEELLTHEVDLLVRSTSVAHHGTVCTSYAAFDSAVVCLLIVHEEIIPESLLRHLECSLANRSNLLIRKRQVAKHRICHRSHSLGSVIIVALNNNYAGVLLLLRSPNTKACQCGCDCRNRECNRLERSVSPWLVVRWVDCQIHTHEQLVIALIENSVVLVEVGRYEDHLNLRLCTVEYAAIDSICHLIPSGIFEDMSRVAVLRSVDWLRLILQVSLQVVACAEICGRHGNISQHLTIELARHLESLQRLEEYIQALVVELVAAACADDERLLLELVHEACLGNLNHSLTSLLALCGVLLATPYEVVLETVWSYNINLLAEQVSTLTSCNIAHREERIVVLCTNLLDRVLCHNIELTSQVVCVELLQVAIERKVVTCNATTHYGCMGTHYSCDIWRVLTQVKTSRAGHPLVEVSHSLLGSCAEVIDIRLDNLTCQVAKEYRLNIVPLARNRIYTVRLPQLLQHLILICKEGCEVDEDCDRITAHIPTTDTNTNTIVIESLTPSLHQHWILDKLGNLAILREVGTDSDISLPHLLRNGQGFRSQYGVNATDLVTYLPADLKENIRIKFYFTHNYLIIC